MKLILSIIILLLLFACSPSQKTADVSLNVNVESDGEYRVNKVRLTTSAIIQQLSDIKLQGKSVQVSLTGSPESQSYIDELTNLIRITPELSSIQIVVILQSDLGYHGT